MMLTKDQKIELGVGAGVLGGLGYYYYTKSRQVTHPVTSPIHTVTKIVTSTSTISETPVTRTVTRTTRTSTAPKTTVTSPSPSSQCKTVNIRTLFGGFLNTATPSFVARLALNTFQVTGYATTGAVINSPTLILPGNYSTKIKQWLRTTNVPANCVQEVIRLVQAYYQANPASSYTFLFQIRPKSRVLPQTPMISESSVTIKAATFKTPRGGFVLPYWTLTLPSPPKMGSTSGATFRAQAPNRLFVNIYDSTGTLMMSIASTDGPYTTTFIEVPGLTEGLTNKALQPIRPGYKIRLAYGYWIAPDAWDIGLWSNPITLPTPNGTLRFP